MNVAKERKKGWGELYTSWSRDCGKQGKTAWRPMTVATTTVLFLQFTLPLIALLHFNTRVSIICDGGFYTALEEYFPVVQVLYVQSGGG